VLVGAGRAAQRRCKQHQRPPHSISPDRQCLDGDSAAVPAQSTSRAIKCDVPDGADPALKRVRRSNRSCREASRVQSLHRDGCSFCAVSSSGDARHARSPGTATATGGEYAHGARRAQRRKLKSGGASYKPPVLVRCTAPSSQGVAGSVATVCGLSGLGRRGASTSESTGERQ
jgi:hypothetical protein